MTPQELAAVPVAVRLATLEAILCPPDPDMGPGQRLSEAVLSLYGCTSGERYPSIARVAADTGQGVRTVRTHHAAAEAAGRITRQERPGAPTVYILPGDDADRAAAAETQSDTGPAALAAESAADLCATLPTPLKKGAGGARSASHTRAIAGDAARPLRGADAAAGSGGETSPDPSPAVPAARSDSRPAEIPRPRSVRAGPPAPEARGTAGQAAEAAAVRRIAARHGPATVQALAETVDRTPYLLGLTPAWPWPASWQWLEDRVDAVLADQYLDHRLRPARAAPAKRKPKARRKPADPENPMRAAWDSWTPGVQRAALARAGLRYNHRPEDEDLELIRAILCGEAPDRAHSRPIRYID